MSINFRGHGGGKRVFTGAAKQTEVDKTKDEIIDDLKRFIDITFKNVGSPKSLEFQHALGHIKKLAVEVERNLGSNIDILQMLDRGNLNKFNAVNGPNDKSMPQNIRVLQNIIFSQDLHACKIMEDERANIENLFEKVIMYLVTAKYGMEKRDYHVVKHAHRLREYGQGN